MKKIETAITSYPRNEGMHSARNYQKCKKMILENTFSKARLYHVVFHRHRSSTIYPVEADFKYAINALGEKLRDNNVPCEWKSAFEWEDEKGGLHLHAMVLVDARPEGNADYWLRHESEGNSWLSETLKAKHIDFHVAEPKGTMHRTRLGYKYRYIYIPKKGGPALEDALSWCSYIFKNRGKEDVSQYVSNIYGSSRPQRKKPTIESKNEAVTEKKANRSPENCPTNKVMVFAGHSLERKAIGTTSASSKAKASDDECRGASRVETSHAALSREIGQIGWSSADRSEMRRFCPIQAPEMACKRMGTLGILQLPYQTSTRSQA